MRALVFLALVGCGSAQPPAPANQAPPPPPAKVDCGDYQRTVGTYTSPVLEGGNVVVVEVMTACGCTHDAFTTQEGSQKVRTAYEAWRGAHCGPINCDQPCPPAKRL